MMKMTETVKQLLIINIIFYVGSNFVGDLAYDLLSLHNPASTDFRIWQPFTHMFMHAKLPELMHIAFNMFALVSFGSALEHYWGAKRFLFFYIVCGLGAAALQLGVNYYELQNTLELASKLHLSPESMKLILNSDMVQGNYYSPQLFEKAIRPILEKENVLNLLDKQSFGALFEGAMQTRETMVGASGAIYGLLIAFAFMFPTAELGIMFIPIPIKAKYFVPGIIAVDLFLGFQGSSLFGAGGTGIAHFAHVGGALTGFLLMWYWRRRMFKHKRWN